MATTPDNRPWAPHPIPSWIIKEFTRRQNDIGFDYPQSVTWTDDGNWQQYKGPMTPWVRVFSNGTGRVNEKSNYPEKSGFILQGGYGFDKSYGVPDNKNVLGYDADGNEHTLDLSSDGNLVSFPNSLSDDKRTVQKFLPVPGITSIDAVIQKERIRKITVNWKCYGYAQLEYMTPYFLSPKISAFVEFGYNHFNPASLLDLRQTNLQKLKELFTVSGSVLYDKNIRESYGLYDVTMGIISGFDFSSQDGITFDCKTEILSKHANYSGVLVNGGTKAESDNTKTDVQSSFASYLEKRVTKLPSCIKLGRNFFEPLDEDEKINPLNFYLDENGKKKIEDRFFVGRKEEYGDKDILNGKSDYDWDKADQKDVWVTFGFLIELANLFFKQPIGINKQDLNPFDLYEIDTKDVIIGAHPNLISCDGSVLLIPNAKAPKFNAGIYYPQPEDPEDNDYQKQFGFGNPSIYSSQSPLRVLDYNKLEPYDRTVAKILRTGTQVRPKSKNVVSFGFGLSETFSFEVPKSLGPFSQKVDSDIEVGTGGAIFRDNLDGIINRFRYSNKLGDKSKPISGTIKKTEQSGMKSFPRWDSAEPFSGKPAGYWGNLNDLYVNTKVIIECAKSSDTVENFYNSLLGKINNAAGKIWELAVIEDDHKLKIVDKKFIQYTKLKIYQFDVGATNKFIKNISFTAQLSNVAANQVIASASTNKTTKNPNGTVSANQPLLFPYGDRFNLLPPTPVTGSKRAKSLLVDDNLEVMKQLQKTPQNSSATNGSYIMSFKTYAPAGAPAQSRADAASRGRGTPNIPANPTRPGTRAAAALQAGPRVTRPLNPNNPAPPSRAAASAPRTTTSTNTPSGGKETGWNIVNLVLPNEALLISIMNDMDFENNSNIYGGQQPGFTVEMTLQGISGLRTFQMFSLKNLPSPYSEREILCQIVDVTHKIENGNWTTTIKAGIRSIRGKAITFTTDGVNEYTINNNPN